MDNLPMGTTEEEAWKQGLISDRYGHCIGEGYAFNSPVYEPELDDAYQDISEYLMLYSELEWPDIEDEE